MASALGPDQSAGSSDTSDLTPDAAKKGEWRHQADLLRVRRPLWTSSGAAIASATRWSASAKGMQGLSVESLLLVLMSAFDQTGHSVTPCATPPRPTSDYLALESSEPRHGKQAYANP